MSAETTGAPPSGTDAGAPPVLALEDVTWGVGGFTILSEIDLEVPGGEFLSVIGPNGAGKTSLLNVMCGLNRARSGRTYLNGEDVTRLRPAARVRRGLGRSFQTSSLFPNLTVTENVRLAAQAARGGSRSLLRLPSARDAATRTGLDALEEVGLGVRAEDAVADLPHGDKRKLEIAMLLCSDPEVLLLDEPTAGVSAEEVGQLVDVVRAVHAGGRTVVMVEHRIELVVDVSDRIAVMHNGRLLTSGAPAAVMADATVQSAYLGETA